MWCCNIIKFKSDRAGNISTIFALIALVLISIAMLAIDSLSIQSSKIKLQDVADAAALSGAASLHIHAYGGEKNAHDQAVQTVVANSNLPFEDIETGVFVNPSTGSVTVDIKQKYSTILPWPKVLQVSHLNVRAVAIGGQELNSCMYILDERKSASLVVNGRSKLLSPNCAIDVHSRSLSAVRTIGTAFIDAESLCVAGSYVGTNYAISPISNCSVKEDPYRNTKISNAIGCMYGATTIRRPTTLQPGVYCNGLRITGNANVRLNPGLYYIKNGTLTIDSRAQLTGANVAFVLEGDSKIHINGSPAVELSPRETGALKGFSVFQINQSNLVSTSLFGGNGETNISGIIYLPTHDLSIVGIFEKTIQTKHLSTLVVNSLNVSGAALLQVSTNANNAGVKKQVRLIH